MSQADALTKKVLCWDTIEISLDLHLVFLKLENVETFDEEIDLDVFDI